MNHVNAIRCNDEYQCSHCGKSWDIHEEAPDCKMTATNITGFKTINYFGLTLEISSGHSSIATDEDGFIFSYSTEPYIADSGEWLVDNSSYCFIGTANLHGLDWRETLRKC